MSLRRRLLTSALTLPVVAAGLVLPATAQADTASGTTARPGTVTLRFAPAPAAGTAAAAVTRNYVRNGSFETPAIADGTYILPRKIQHWATVAPSGPIELQRGVLGPARDGAQNIELDSTSSSTVTQTVTVPKAGVSYNLVLSAAARPGKSVAENTFTVTVAGKTASGSLDGAGLQTLVWHDIMPVAFTPTSTTFTLSIADAGPSDGVGALIDDVWISRA